MNLDNSFIKRYFNHSVKIVSPSTVRYTDEYLISNFKQIGLKTNIEELIQLTGYSRQYLSRRLEKN